MCGRFINRLTWREIVALYRLNVPAELERNLPGRHNICPTDTIDAVVERDGRRDLVPMPVGPRAVVVEERKRARRLGHVRARAETVTSKPCFVTHSSASAA